MDLTNIRPIALSIKVLGTGCAKCENLEQNTKKAVAELNLDATIEKVEDIQEIMKYGILSTPGLIINEKTVLSGRVPKIDELKELISTSIA